MFMNDMIWVQRNSNGKLVYVKSLDNIKDTSDWEPAFQCLVLSDEDSAMVKAILEKKKK